MCNLVKCKSSLWKDLSALVNRLQSPAWFWMLASWSQTLAFVVHASEVAPASAKRCLPGLRVRHSSWMQNWLFKPFFQAETGRKRNCSLRLSPPLSHTVSWETSSSFDSQAFNLAKPDCLPRASLLLRPCPTSHIHHFRCRPAAFRLSAVTELDANQLCTYSPSMCCKCSRTWGVWRVSCPWIEAS